ncbi:MAG: protein kinase domain-containing protein [Burkholderiales bacterium]
MRELHRVVCEVVLAHDGCVLDLGEDRFLAAFGPGLAAPLDGAVQAAKAAIQLQIELARLRGTRAAQGSNGESALALTIGIHGIGVPVTIGTGANDAGQTVACELAVKLCNWSGARAWSIVIEQSLRDRIAGAVVIGRSEIVFLNQHPGPIRLFEVVGLAPDAKSRPDVRSGGSVLKVLTDNGSMLAQAVGLKRPVARGALTPDSSPATSGPMPKIEGYRVVRRIGRGGTSTVYLGLPTQGGAPHALKVLDIIDNEALVQRFIEEHALIAQLRHPNVVRIYGQEFTAAHAYIAMEYVSGGDLRALIAAGVRPSNALRILAQIAAGLAAIHEAGILHMDLKPDNVMLREDGSLAIADFGIAQTKDRASRGTQDDEAFGTPQYVSPEHALSKPTDARSDLYSLGVLLYEMLVGRKPFSADLSERTNEHSDQDQPQQLPQRLSALQPLVDVLLAHEPFDRLGSARELLDFIPVFFAAAETADLTHSTTTDVDRRMTHDRTVPLPNVVASGSSDAVSNKKANPMTALSGSGRPVS